MLPSTNFGPTAAEIMQERISICTLSHFIVFSNIKLLRGKKIKILAADLHNIGKYLKYKTTARQENFTTSFD